MNILQISEALKGVPKDFLVREATMPSGNYPQYLVVSELSRRTAMEKQFAGIAAQQNQPQETVADKTVREATPMPMAAMQGLKSPQTTYQEEPSGQETMGVPAAVRMFEGGRVSFEKGGLGEDGVNRSFLGGIYDKVKTFGKGIFGGDPTVGTGMTEDKEKLIEELKRKIRSGEIDATRGEKQIKQIYGAGDERYDAIQSYKSDLRDLGVEDKFFRGIASETKNTLNNLEIKKKYAKSDEERNAIQAQIDEIQGRVKEGIPSIETPVTDQVDKDQANRKKQLQKEADQSATKEKDALSEFERLSKEKYEMPELKSTLNTEEAFKLLGDAPTEKTFENVMKDLSNARQEDFLKVVEENTNKMQDGIDKEKRQAIPMSLISAGLAIASAPSGSGLLGAITEGAKAGFSKFEGLQKDIKSSEKAFRDAQNALAMAKDARQEGDMKTAREQVNRYEDKMESYKDKQVNINMEVQKQLASNDQLRYQTEVQMLNSERNRELEMAKKRYERAASDKQARAALAAEHDMKINEAIMTLNQYKLEVRSNTLMDDEQKAIAIAEANAQINAYRGINIEDDVEKKKEGGTIKAPKNNSYRSVFDFT